MHVRERIISKSNFQIFFINEQEFWLYLQEIYTKKSLTRKQSR